MNNENVPCPRRRISSSYNLCGCSSSRLWEGELHGLSQLLQTTDCWSRTWWASLIVFCLGVAAWLSHVLSDEYADLSTTTLLTVEHNKRLTYPNITLCPERPDALNYDSLRKDFTTVFPNATKSLFYDVVAFAIAGAGLKNIHHYVYRWNDSYIDHLSVLFNTWRGNRSIDAFYRYLFEDNGYDCEKFFHHCSYGRRSLRCCQIFYPMYVSLRGRCFRLKTMSQEDHGANGKLTVVMRQLHSPLMEPGRLQRQSVLYITDSFVDTLWFPRFFIMRNTFMQFSLSATRYNMSHSQGCSMTNSITHCLIREWLEAHLIRPLRCVPFYMQHHAKQLEHCPPERLVRNYGDVINVTGLNPCKPACSRTIVRVTDSSTRRVEDAVPAFGVSFAYDRLETDRYDEAVLTTLPGFISQIGGQFGLMLGISIASIVQLIVGVTLHLYRLPGRLGRCCSCK